MKEVNFTDGQIAVTNQENSQIAVIIEYNDSKSYAIYLDVPVSEARKRFTERMNERSELEIKNEGWDAKISRMTITDEIHICRGWDSLVSGLTQAMSNTQSRTK